MNREDIIRIAQEAQMPFYWRTGEITYLDKLEAFAALVIANHPPQSFMTWQVGYEAGKHDEREACVKVCEDHPTWTGRMCGETIKARGQA